MELTARQLSQKLKADLIGPDDVMIRAVNTLAASTQHDVTFVTDQKRMDDLENCQAGAVILAETVEGLKQTQLIVDNVDAALIEALKLFAPELEPVKPGIDKTAIIAEDADIGKDVFIGPGAIIDKGVKIGNNTVISSGCKIGQNSIIGQNCRLDCNVVIYHNCTIGNHVIIQANTTIGSVGFGYKLIEGQHRLIPHNGGVVIEDFVDIGANCCIDRAKFQNTVIGAGTKIDNLVQIAHNVIIGKCCILVAQVGIAGSCKLGDRVVLGGQAALADNVTVGDRAMIAGKSSAIEDVPAGKKLYGSPAVESRAALQRFNAGKTAAKLSDKLKELTKRVKLLESAKDNKK